MKNRREAYHAIFKAHLDQEIDGQIRNATNGNYALGSERFRKKTKRHWDGGRSAGRVAR